MIHQLRDKKRISRRKIIIRNVSIVGVLLLLGLTGILAWSGKLFIGIGRPLWKAENSLTATIHTATSLVRTKSSVFAENDKLIQENTDLKNSMVDYQILKSENDQLKEMLGRMPAKSNFTLATILTKPNRSPYDTIIVDGGSNIGFTEGMHVFANGTMPIGEISKVYDNASLVMLYSNPGQITEAVLDGSNTAVELIGRGGGNFEMTIPLDLSAENGRLVVLPSATSEVVAIVDAILSVPTDPMKKVLLRSPVNIQSLKWVEIKKD